MTRTELQEIIDREFDNFIEFPDDRREAVTVASCKLFAEHVVEVIQAHPELPEGWDAQAYASMRGEIGYHKRRADVAEMALSRIRDDLSPTHMGEPMLDRDRGEYLGWISYLESGRSTDQAAHRIALCMRSALKHLHSPQHPEGVKQSLTAEQQPHGGRWRESDETETT